MHKVLIVVCREAQGPRMFGLIRWLNYAATLWPYLENTRVVVAVTQRGGGSTNHQSDAQRSNTRSKHAMLRQAASSPAAAGSGRANKATGLSSNRPTAQGRAASSQKSSLQAMCQPWYKGIIKDFNTASGEQTCFISSYHQTQRGSTLSVNGDGLGRSPRPNLRMFPLYLHVGGG